MSTDYKNSHTAQVDAWLKRTAKGVPAEKLAAFFGHGIQALWHRSSITLSDVTLLVIFDRALVICQEKHPLLSSLKLDEKGVNVDGLVQIHEFTQNQIHEAFRCFIVEVITIVGSLTAEILTDPLYKELSLMTVDRASIESSPSSLESKTAAGTKRNNHD